MKQKIQNRSILVLMILLMIHSVWGAGNLALAIPRAEAAVQTITLSHNTLRLPVGGFFFLQIVESSSGEKAVWSSSDSNVVKVFQNGRIQTVGLGESDITVQKGSAVAVCHVTVCSPLAVWTYETKYGELDSWYLDPGKKDMAFYRYQVDVPAVLSVTLGEKTKGAYKIVIRDDCGNLILSENVKASLSRLRSYFLDVSAGVYSVNLVSDELEYELQVDMLLMQQVPVKSMRLDCNSLTLAAGEKTKLIATVKPKYTTDDFFWSSSNPNVAKVNANGVVKAKRLGRTKVAVTCGEIVKRCNVLVDQMEVSITAEKEISFVPFVKNINKYKNGTWSISNSEIASVTADGIVTGKKTGKTDIFFQATDGTIYTIHTKIQVIPVVIKAVGFSYAFDDGDWCVEVKIKNRTNHYIDRVDFDILQYDRNGNRLESPLDAYWFDQRYIGPKNTVTDWYYSVNRKTTSVVFVVKKVKFVDGPTMTF